MKVKRKQIKEALQNKFLGLEKLTMTLPEVIKYSNEAIDELYWEYKQEKAAEDSGKEEQKELDIVEVLNTAHAIEQVIGSTQLIYALLCSMPADEGMRILSGIINDFELSTKGGNKNG